MSKITKLTPDQIARFPEFVDRWTKIGLCTDPADRPRAEAAIREMYRHGGLEPPKKIVWCGSPLSQGLTRAIILDSKLRASVWASVGDSVGASVRDSVGDSVRASVWASVWDSVWASVGASVRDSVGDSVRDSVGASVRASVWDSVWASVGASVRDSVGASVRASVGDSVRDSVRDSVWASVGALVWASVYGQHDAGWLAFYNYFSEAVSLTQQTSKLCGLLELARSSGWALPHQNICWVSERHHILQRDERGRLHCMAGPAVAYPDGWSIYAVHGVRVPEYIINRPEEIGVKIIDAETNAEVRRVMIERYRHGNEIAGAGAYLKDSHAKRIDHDEQFGTLYRRDVPGDEPIVMIEVINRSPEPDGHFRHYMLRVPPNVQSAHEAVAWTFGKTVKEYQPSVET